jgi:hypothetical protein
MNSSKIEFKKIEFKQIDFNLIRLEPQYLTKYGKQYNYLYNPYKNPTIEEHYIKYKNKQFISFWENIKENENEDEDKDKYYSSLELENYNQQPINYDKEVESDDEIYQNAESSDSEEEYVTL